MSYKDPMGNKGYHLLFPGRHHLLTQFQIQYLSNILKQKDISELLDFNGEKLGISGIITDVIFAITSANHKNTKRNPLSGIRRTELIQFVCQHSSIDPSIFHIDDKGTTDKFSEYVLKSIYHQSNNGLELTPNNTIVATSTKSIARQYEGLGFKVLPVEYNPQKKIFDQKIPREILDEINLNMRTTGSINGVHSRILLDKECEKFFTKYHIRLLFQKIYSDYTTNSDGALTDTRDFNTYGRSFEDGSQRKYDVIKDDIIGGVIVDIGCCTGGLLKKISQDSKFSDSDLYGTDVVASFIDRCESDHRVGMYKNDNTFFLQCNMIDYTIFYPNTINTAISFALTHEVISYNDMSKLNTFIKNLYNQLIFGGRWINYDVIGPDNPEEIIIAELNTNDGNDWDEQKFQGLFTLVQNDYNKNQDSRRSYIVGLSTYAKFILFTKTFRYKQGDWKSTHKELLKGKIEIKSRDIAEFMSKKDYSDNRLSEMNEYFCSLTFNDRKLLVKDYGFEVDKKSELIYNEWIYTNRFNGKVTLYDKKTSEKKAYFPTNIKLICNKCI